METEARGREFVEQLRRIVKRARGKDVAVDEIERPALFDATDRAKGRPGAGLPAVSPRRVDTADVVRGEIDRGELVIENGDQRYADLLVRARVAGIRLVKCSRDRFV